MRPTARRSCGLRWRPSTHLARGAAAPRESRAPRARRGGGGAGRGARADAASPTAARDGGRRRRCATRARRRRRRMSFRCARRRGSLAFSRAEASRRRSSASCARRRLRSPIATATQYAACVERGARVEGAGETNALPWQRRRRMESRTAAPLSSFDVKSALARSLGGYALRGQSGRRGARRGRCGLRSTRVRGPAALWAGD